MLTESTRKLFLLTVIALACVLGAGSGSAATIDRIAAVADREVITVSELNQMVTLRFFFRAPEVSDDDYRRQILELVIAQALRYRDVERFGAQEISKDAIEARKKEIARRFSSPTELDAAVVRAELSAEELNALIKRQLQVEAYIQERFSPLIFVPTEEIEIFYRDTWSKQRRERGLAVPPLSEVREEIRALLKGSRLQDEIEKWTTQLRARTNVDIYAWR